MPKLKTNSGMKKRVRVTASGKFKRRSAFKSHLAATKSVKRKRHLRKASLIHDHNAHAVSQLLPNGR
jgi:large subunit ribosomal protein L35